MRMRRTQARGGSNSMAVLDELPPVGVLEVVAFSVGAGEWGVAAGLMVMVLLYFFYW